MNDETKDVVLIGLVIINVILMIALWDEKQERKERRRR